MHFASRKTGIYCEPLVCALCVFFFRVRWHVQNERSQRLPQAWVDSSMAQRAANEHCFLCSSFKIVPPRFFSDGITNAFWNTLVCSILSGESHFWRISLFKIVCWHARFLKTSRLAVLILECRFSQNMQSSTKEPRWNYYGGKFIFKATAQ